MPPDMPYQSLIIPATGAASAESVTGVKVYAINGILSRPGSVCVHVLHEKVVLDIVSLSLADASTLYSSIGEAIASLNDADDQPA